MSKKSLKSIVGANSQSNIYAKVQGVNYIRDMVREKTETVDRIRGYLAFVPAMLVRMLEAQALATKHHNVSADITYQHGIVFFADISGFTKLTERLADEPNGAERLCFELDKVYALILSEADKWGGDCIKFAGDAVLFCWPIHAEEGTEAFDLEYKECAVRAAHCSYLIHESVKKHPEVAGVKLTLHAGMGCGKLAACLLGGCFSRWEFVIAGEPMGQIAKSEPAAQPGETVYSPEIAALLKDLVIAEEITGEDDPAKGYFRHRGMSEVEGQEVQPPPDTLSNITFQAINEKTVHRICNFVPNYISNILDDHTDMSEAHVSDSDDSITDGRGRVSSLGRSEMREATTIFIKLIGIDLSKDLNGSQEVFRCVQDAAYTYSGSINKLLVDDKGTLVVLVFGLPPLVHRDNAVRAIAACFLLIKLLKKLNEKRRDRFNPAEMTEPEPEVSCNIGVTSARTFCGTIGAEHRREFTVMGDSVNLAARLMAACSTTVIPSGHESILSMQQQEGDDGETVWKPLLLVDHTTAEEADMAVQFSHLGSIRVKGKSHPVDLYQPTHFYDSTSGITHMKTRSTLLRAKSSFEDLDQLDLVGAGAAENAKKLEEAVAKLSSKPIGGESGPTVMLISGAQGVGKHSLATKLVDICPKHNVVIACSTPNTSTRNVFEDGEVELTSEFTPFRGPLLSMLNTVVARGLLPAYQDPPGTPPNSEVNIYRAARVILPKYLQKDVPLFSLMYPEMVDNSIDIVKSMEEEEEIEVEDISPLFREHVAERMEYLHSRLNKDKSFKVTIAGEMDGTNPTCLLGRGDEAQHWADASMAHAYPGFMKMLDDSVHELYNQFPTQVSFGDVSSESASPTHYQVWGGHALNWKVEGEGSAIVGASQPGITTQKEGVFGVVTSPLHGAPAGSDDKIAAKKKFRMSDMNRLVRIVVALITKTIELADGQDSNEFSTPTKIKDKSRGSLSDLKERLKNREMAKSVDGSTVDSSEDSSDVEVDHTSTKPPPFQFLIVIEHAHVSMPQDARSWEIVNALMKIGAQTKAASSAKHVKRMSTVEAMATSFASASRPLLCMVSRPLKGRFATAEYMHLVSTATKYDTLINVSSMSAADTSLLLRRSIAKHLWQHAGPTLKEAAELRRSKFLFHDFEQCVCLDQELVDFTWECTHGCASEIIAMYENFFQTNSLGFSLSADQDTLTVKVAQGKNLDTMPLSQVLKSSAMSRFHAKLDEKPFIWSHIAQLSSCFHLQFSPSMLCQLLKSMKNHDGESCGLNFTEKYLTKMIHSLVACDIFEPSNQAITDKAFDGNSYQFKSKLVSHALRETLLQSQLEMCINPQLRVYCLSLMLLWEALED